MIFVIFDKKGFSRKILAAQREPMLPVTILKIIIRERFTCIILNGARGSHI